jgi:hypothetical protein
MACAHAKRKCMRRFSNGVAIGVHEKDANAWFPRSMWWCSTSWIDSLSNPSMILGPSGEGEKRRKIG